MFLYTDDAFVSSFQKFNETLYTLQADNLKDRLQEVLKTSSANPESRDDKIAAFFRKFRSPPLQVTGLFIEDHHGVFKSYKPHLFGIGEFWQNADTLKTLDTPKMKFIPLQTTPRLYLGFTLALPEIKTLRHHLKADFFLFLVFICFLALVSAWFLKRFVATPLHNLAQDIDTLKHIRFQKRTRPYLSELQLIYKALEGLFKALQAFEKYVPKVLVSELLYAGHGAQQKMRKEELTILFSDIQGFTSEVERTDPNDLVSALSAYFDTLSKHIHHNNGTIDKYIGDAIMAFWGAPIKDLTHASHACKAALLCHHATLQRNSFKSRFGIATGEVLVGNVGAQDRFQYTVLGNAVNLASRLESLNKVYGTHILVDDTLFQRVFKTFILRPVDITAVRGQKKRHKIYELIGSHATPLFGNPDILMTKASLTKQAFETYQEGALAKAHALYKNLALRDPTDMLARYFVERIRQEAKQGILA